MKIILFAITFGWLLSAWIQVPPPLRAVVKETVKSAISFVKTSVVDVYTEITGPGKIA